MSVSLFNIIPALQPYIKTICIIETDEATPSQFRVLPDTCVELFISYSAIAVSLDGFIEGPMKNYVCSNTLKEAGEGVTIISGDIEKQITAIKQQQDKDKQEEKLVFHTIRSREPAAKRQPAYTRTVFPAR